MRPPGPLFEAIQQNSRTILNRLFEPAPDTLYHYTSAEGLLGILRSGQLRGSNFTFMNDRSEFKYGATLLREVIEHRARSLKNDVDQDFYEAILSSTRPVISDLYLVCFCTERDLLSQWRGYGHSGSRYCLRFTSDGFAPLNGASPLVPVCYELKMQCEILNRILDAHIQALYDFPRAQRSHDLFGLFASCIYACCIGAFAVFKDDAFKEEHEWRSVVLARPGELVEHLDFWSSAGVMKPTIPLLGGSAGTLPLREVMCGASALPEQAVRSAELMLARFQYSSVVVNASRIPLSG